MRRIGALSGTKDFVAGLVFGVGKACRRGDDDAGEFVASGPRKGWLVLVFALDLEDVEEVCCGSMDGDEVLVGLDSEPGKGCYREAVRTLIAILVG